MKWNDAPAPALLSTRGLSKTLYFHVLSSFLRPVSDSFTTPFHNGRRTAAPSVVPCRDPSPEMRSWEGISAGIGPFRLRIYPQKRWVRHRSGRLKSQAQKSAIFLKKGRKRCLTGSGHPPINRLHEVTAALLLRKRFAPSGKRVQGPCPDAFFVA